MEYFGWVGSFIADEEEQGRQNSTFWRGWTLE